MREIPSILDDHKRKKLNKGNNTNQNQFTTHTKEEPDKTMAEKSKRKTGTITGTGADTGATTTQRLTQQLNDTTAQVIHNIMRMDVLHQQWMNYLFVLSFIVVLISMYQIYSNFDSNYNNIDITNGGNHDRHRRHELKLFLSQLPKPLRVLLHIDYSIITYIVSTCMSIFLFLFMIDVKQRLQEQQPLSNSMTAIFRHFYFRMAQFCFLPTMVLYSYQSKNSNSSITSSPSILHQQFPIVIIYFVIATVCIWFMRDQAERMYRSYNALVRLKMELKQKEFEQQQNEQLQSTGSKKKK